MKELFIGLMEGHMWYFLGFTIGVLIYNLFKKIVL